MSAGEKNVARARRSIAVAAVMLVVVTLSLARESKAFPYFARKYDVSCHTCHSIVPKLNATGYAFRSYGYRFPGVPVRKTIPFAGGFAVRYENRQSDRVDDLYLAIVKAVTGGSIGDNTSYLVKWRPYNRSLDSSGRLVDRSGIFEDALINLGLNDTTWLTVGQFRVFNQYDQARQLSASPPVALAMPLPGDAADTPRQTALRAYSPIARTPGLMLSYHHPGDRDESNAADGLYLHGSLAFPGEFAIPVTERAQRSASFEFEAAPKGFVFESYYRFGGSSAGGAAFIDAGRQMYTGLVSYERARWATAAAISSHVLDGESMFLTSWWGEYRPTYFTNVGLRLDDPGMGSLGAVIYGDYQWFTERAMVWVIAEQSFKTGNTRTLFQAKMVF